MTRQVPTPHHTEVPTRARSGSVQISAAPGTLYGVQKANGYDGHFFRAEVKGQTYYRLRVGRFDAREEAESVRQSLARREGYRHAYLNAIDRPQHEGRSPLNACSRFDNRVIVLNGRYTASASSAFTNYGQAKPGQNTKI